MKQNLVPATSATSPTAASASATTAAAVATTAVATTTTSAVFAGFGLIDRKLPAIVFLFIQAVNRSLRFGITGHFHESESFATARVTVRDDLGAFNRAEL